MRSPLLPVRRRAAVHLVASATAVLFVVGQVGSYAHLVNVEHEVCAEHGELVDVARESAAGPATESEAATGWHLLPSSRAETGHQHDHCAVAPQRRERSIGAEHHQAAGAAPPAEPQHLGTERRVASATQAIYRIAPKTSPPA